MKHALWATFGSMLAVAGCDADFPTPTSSVTIKLPQPRPAEAKPGFSSAVAPKVPSRSN